MAFDVALDALAVPLVPSSPHRDPAPPIFGHVGTLGGDMDADWGRSSGWCSGCTEPDLQRSIDRLDESKVSRSVCLCLSPKLTLTALINALLAGIPVALGTRAASQAG